MKKLLTLILFVFLFTQYVFSQGLTKPAPEIEVSADKGKTSENIIVFTIKYIFPENFHQTLNRDFFRAQLISPEKAVRQDIVYPEGTTENGVVNYYKSAEIKLSTEGWDLEPGGYDYSVRVHYQLCDENGTCYLPGSEDISGTFEILESDINNKNSSGISELLKYIVFAFIGGILLNIMPCVFPLLSIKALTLIKMSENNKKQIFLSSLSYSAGIIASLLVLAVSLIVLKSAGQFAGWGFQMQNRWFVLILVSVIYLFALSMFDLFTITLPGQGIAGKASQRKGYTGQFMTGIFAVLVAAPCTAPFLGSAIAFSLSKNSLFILFSFFAIGTGFALPFILLGLYPAVIKKLPKPGKWSIYFKEILGFILVGTSIYILLSFSKGKTVEELAGILIFLFFLTFFAWIYGKSSVSGISRIKIRIITAVLIISTLITGSIFLGYSNKNEKLPDISGIENDFTAEKLKNLTEAGQAVFVDIYADWCTTCKINERFVLSSREITAFFNENNIKVIKGDFTDNNPEIAAWMMENGKAGVPVYAYFHDARSAPVFFPELLTKKIITDKISSFYQ